MTSTLDIHLFTITKYKRGSRTYPMAEISQLQCHNVIAHEK